MHVNRFSEDGRTKISKQQNRKKILYALIRSGQNISVMGKKNDSSLLQHAIKPSGKSI